MVESLRSKVKVARRLKRGAGSETDWLPVFVLSKHKSETLEHVKYPIPKGQGAYGADAKTRKAGQHAETRVEILVAQRKRLIEHHYQPFCMFTRQQTTGSQATGDECAID